MGKARKDTVSNNASLMKEWDFEKNDPLGFDPAEIGIGSHYKVWWKCQEGHSWEAMVSNRARHGRGCPYCSHQIELKMAYHIFVNKRKDFKDDKIWRRG